MKDNPVHASVPIVSSTAVRRLAMGAFTAALAFGGGLWLHLIHETLGASERNEPPPLVHWLRDSTLSLPVVFGAVWLALLVSRRLLARTGRADARLLAGTVTAAITALVVSAALAAASPIHGAMFGAHHHHGGQEMPALLHIAYDGVLGLSANLAFAGLVALLLRGRVFTDRPARAARVPRTRPGRPGRVLAPVLFAAVLVPALGLLAISRGDQGAGVFAAADLGQACLDGSATGVKRFAVTAIDIKIPLNRFGDSDPAGKMYVLNSRIADVQAQAAKFGNPDQVFIGLNGFPAQDASGKVAMQEDTIQPLFIRANEGDCVVIDFTNNATGGSYGIHIDGLSFNMASSGNAVGNNTASDVPQGGTATYRFYIPNDANLEGSHYLHPGAGNRAAANHGLFGALNVEPPGSTYLKPDGTPITDPTTDSR